MIAVELGNGRTVFLTLDEWLDMTHERYQELIANNEGYEIDNPFDKILSRIKDNPRDVLDIDLPNLPKETDQTIGTDDPET